MNYLSLRHMSLVTIGCVLIALVGCVPPFNNEGSSSEDPAGQPAPPVDNGDDAADQPADSALLIDDGTFGGTVNQEVRLGEDAQALPLSLNRSRYVLMTVSDGAVTSLRFGSARFGQFAPWRVAESGVNDVSFLLGDGSVRVTRTLSQLGSSLLRFAVEARRLETLGESSGSGDGLLTLKVVDGAIEFSLLETVIYDAGPLAGEKQMGQLFGTLSRIEDLPPITPAGGNTVEDAGDDAGDDAGNGADGGGGDASNQGGTDQTDEPAPPPTVPGEDGEPAEFANSGVEVLPDGTSRTYSGSREVAESTETATGPGGEELGVVEDNLVRTFVSSDGSTTSETDTSKVYFEYDETGRGRIVGYHENGVDRFIVDPAEGVPGSVDALEVGQSRSYTATFDDGTVDVFTEEITEMSEVVLPAGVYEVYVSVSRLERTRPDGTIEIADIVASIHPTMGMVYRQVTGSIRKPDGSLKTTEFEEFLGPAAQ